MRYRLVSIALAAALPGVAHANASQPVFPGDPTGEPRGVHGIAIADEHLTIDLRSLPDTERARVTATYRLANAGDAQQLSLVFTTGVRAVQDFAVSLDGRAIAGAGLATGPLPQAWQAPATTPGLDGGAARPYELESAVAEAFAVTVPAGTHELTVRYAAQATLDVRPDDSPTKIYQLAYVLAPARTWDSFGGLDLTIEAPAGWRIAVTPALPRTGDTLQAHFPTLPADAIAITATASVGALYPALRVGAPALALLVVLGGGGALWRRGARRGRADRSAGATLGGFGWAVAVLATGLLVADRGDLAVSARDAVRNGYERGFLAVGVVVLAAIAWPAGAVIAWLGWRRTSRPPPDAP